MYYNEQTVLITVKDLSEGGQTSKFDLIIRSESTNQDDGEESSTLSAGGATSSQTKEDEKEEEVKSQEELEEIAKQ